MSVMDGLLGNLTRSTTKSLLGQLRDIHRSHFLIQSPIGNRSVWSIEGINHIQRTILPFMKVTSASRCLRILNDVLKIGKLREKITPSLGCVHGHVR